MRAIHSNLGEVKIDDACLVMQRMNSDPTSMFVHHKGETKEVSKNMVTIIKDDENSNPIN